MRQLLSRLSLLLILGFATSSFAAAPHPSADRNQTHPFSSNGHFLVSVHQDGAWKEVAKLPADRFIRRHEVEVTTPSSDSHTLRIKIAKVGGGASHFDEINLLEKSSRYVWRNKDNSLEKKLTKKDLDLTECPAGGLELNFSLQNTKPVTLLLSGRIESKTISTEEFKYPRSNLFQPIGHTSEFYTYDLTSKASQATIENLFDSKTRVKPLFRAFSTSGSGHPSGYTYGWVSHDKKDLYAVIDFTSDNTMDGEKDFAKLFVKRGDQIKEYKVSKPMNTWGKPHFMYTKNAHYQHKVYQFQIPLAELGIGDTHKEKPLEVAFSTYGTSSPGDYSPRVAYDSYRNQYLCVFNEVGSSDTNVFGRLLSHDGTFLGERFAISEEEKTQALIRVAYDSINHRFMAVWGDGRNGTSVADVYGQIINGNGTLNGSEFPITEQLGTHSKYAPDIAYDSTTGQFLVVWEDDRNTNDDIYGQLVNPDGTLEGPNVQIENHTANQWQPAVSYDPINKKFLVTWHDLRNGGNRDIYGAIVSPSGTVSPTDIRISNEGGFERYSSVAANTTDGGFLVAFNEDPTSNAPDIAAQRVSADGTLSGAIIMVAETTRDEENASVAYDSASNQFFVAWSDMETGDSAIRGQALGAGGSLTGDQVEVVDGSTYELNNHVAFNSNCNNFMNVYEVTDTSSFTIGASQVGTACSSPPTAPVLTSPTNGAEGITASVGFLWDASTDPDGDDVTYDFYLCEDENMEGCAPQSVTLSSTARLSLAGGGLLLLLGLAFPFFRKKKTWHLSLLGIIALGFAGFQLTCSSEPSSNDSYNHQETNLTANTTYYWQVIAKDGKGGQASSETWSFTTADF